MESTIPRAPPVSPPPETQGAVASKIVDVYVARHDSVRTDEWLARGVVKVSGAVEATRATVVGAASVGGALTVRSLTVDGTLDVRGPATISESVRIDGVGTFSAAVSAGQVDARGTLRLGQDLVGSGNFRHVGRLEIAGSVTAADFEVDGWVQVTGGISAQSVSVRWRGTSRLGTVRARMVTIRDAPGRTRYDSLTVDRIEAETVDLEYVEVGFLRSPTIRLGPRAQVTELEGNVVAQHRTARVGPESRTPPPHGLRF